MWSKREIKILKWNINCFLFWSTIHDKRFIRKISLKLNKNQVKAMIITQNNINFKCSFYHIIWRKKQLHISCCLPGFKRTFWITAKIGLGSKVWCQWRLENFFYKLSENNAYSPKQYKFQMLILSFNLEKETVGNKAFYV